MEPPRPPFRCRPKSEAAGVALGHLQGVEKQLQNEGFDFSKGTIQHLEDAIKAVKDLEFDRKHTLELLEEETIKNCCLRIKVTGLPEIVMKEFEELVAAAQRHRLQKLYEIESAIKEINSVAEAVQSKLSLSEQQNSALGKEQEELWGQHSEAVQLLNEQMAEKHSLNIEINELHNRKKFEEEEITCERDAIEELKETMAREASEFRLKKDGLHKQITDLQNKLAIQDRENDIKRTEYLHLLGILKGLDKEVADYTEIVANQREKLAEIFKRIRQLVKDLEEKKAKKEEILKKQAEMTAQVTSLDSTFEEDKEKLLKQLLQAEEELKALKRENEKLTNENNLFSTQYRTLIDQEDELRAQRDHLADEFEKLSNMLTEKLDLVAKRLLETKLLEEEVDRLQEVYQVTESNYAREISNLEVTLSRESTKRNEFQDRLVAITDKSKKMVAEHEEFLEKSAQRSEASKRVLLGLTSQNEELRRQLAKAAEMIKSLSNKLRKKTAFYKKRDTDLETEIKKLHDEYDEIKRLLQEKEEQLKINIPLSEQLEAELEQMTTTFDGQKELFQVLTEEDNALKKSLDRSTKEIAKLRRLKIQTKADLKKTREIALDQLAKYTHSLKFLERDFYEVSRKLYILNVENDRIRAGIAYLKEDISAMSKEAKAFQAERQETQKETRALHGLFIKKWIKDNLLQEMFLKYQHDILAILAEFIRRCGKRNDKLDYVHDGLQLNLEAMESLLLSKSSEDEVKELKDQKGCGLKSEN